MPLIPLAETNLNDTQMIIDDLINNLAINSDDCSLLNLNEINKQFPIADDGQIYYLPHIIEYVEITPEQQLSKENIRFFAQGKLVSLQDIKNDSSLLNQLLGYQNSYNLLRVFKPSLPSLNNLPSEVMEDFRAYKKQAHDSHMAEIQRLKPLIKRERWVFLAQILATLLTIMALILMSTLITSAVISSLLVPLFLFTSISIPVGATIGLSCIALAILCGSSSIGKAFDYIYNNYLCPQIDTLFNVEAQMDSQEFAVLNLNDDLDLHKEYCEKLNESINLSNQFDYQEKDNNEPNVCWRKCDPTPSLSQQYFFSSQRYNPPKPNDDLRSDLIPKM